MLVKTSTLHYHIVQVLLTCGSCKERNILKKKNVSDQEKIHKSQKRGRFKKVGKMPIFISTSSYPGSEQQRNYDKKNLCTS